MKFIAILFVFSLSLLNSCSKKLATGTTTQKTTYKWNEFVMGADLSYVNEIEDFGGTYKQDNLVKDVFGIFNNIGTNTVRVRLWHTPTWMLPYSGNKYYCNLPDVAKTIQRARSAGMAVNLDLHFSDDWASPSQQSTPAAWAGLTLSTLKDSVYNYTLSVLNYLNARGLTPEMIQVGNEINGGMLWPMGKINSPTDWPALGTLLNSGIKAVRDFSATSTIKPQIILHEAQLQTAVDWYNNIITRGSVTDFDIIGLSHYYKWTTVHAMNDAGAIIKQLKSTYPAKKVMIVETAFSWTYDNADTYNNIFWNSTSSADGYPVSKEGMNQYLHDLTQQVFTNGGSGIMVWEPAWITSPMKDRWGTGSSWENNTYFDFGGNLIPQVGFMTDKY